jgi:signal transduction histidine kinase
MALRTFLEPTHLLQTIVLALSIFNLIAFLWLAFTVWLNGNRNSLIARVGIVGLGLSALFFFLHALLIFDPLSQKDGLVTADVLWHLIWLPALGVPYIWFVIGLHYAALINQGWRRRRPALLIWSALLGCSVLILLILNQSTFTFLGTIRLLAYGDVPEPNDISILSPLVLLPILFLCYVTFCAIGPWFTPARVGRLLHALLHVSVKHGSLLRQRLADVFWDDPMQVDLLEEPVLSWHLARPGLLVAALLMVGLTTCLGVLGVWSMVSWLRHGGNIDSAVPIHMSVFPLNLIILDIIATGFVAFIILLLGYSIVRHGILIERPLARRGFFEQWRGIVIVATTIAIFIALLVALTHSNLGGLLLITSLATAAYALFTWSSYTAHDRYISMLGPFLRSANLRHWLQTDVEKTEQSMEDLFFHLCSDVLEVQCARLIVFTGSVRRSFTYRWPLSDTASEDNETLVLTKTLPQLQAIKNDDRELARRTPTRVRMTRHGRPIICWVLPIYDELGVVATFYLGPRHDRSLFTEEDMDIAQACGQRILDTLRDHEAMQAVAGLLRRRIVDVKLLDAQHRRVLHDEILPQMHLALLRLETVRYTLHDEHEHAINNTQQKEALDDAVHAISDAHRRLATMMRANTPSAPHRLERDGMLHAIRAMLKQDFQQAFDEVEWAISEGTMSRIDEIVPPTIAELIFAAVQEALRNAARHGRGSDVHRRLCLSMKASYSTHLEILVIDDGVGIVSSTSSTTGTGGGLLTHSALLAITGGSLIVKSSPGGGVTVRIFLPAESLC